jgi:hypothetical protein
MTEEELLREARLYGAAEPEELTYGEVLQVLELGAERERRALQQLALIAYRHAALTAQALAGQRLPPLEEAFPFWSEEEIQRAKVARLRRRLERYAARSGGKEEEYGTHTKCDDDQERSGQPGHQPDAPV